MSWQGRDSPHWAGRHRHATLVTRDAVALTIRNLSATDNVACRVLMTG